MADNTLGFRLEVDNEATFRKSINAINAEMKSLASEMKAVTAEFAENAKSEEALSARNEVLGRSVEAAKSKMSTLDSQLSRQRQELDRLAQELSEAARQYGATSDEAARAQNRFNEQSAQVSRLEEQYQNARRQLAEFERQMRDAGDASDETTEQLNGVDVMAGAAAWDMVKTAVRGVVSVMEDAITVGMEFDRSISEVAATMGTTVDSLNDLRGFAQEMGATTAFTATEAAQALNYMALAGYNAEEAMSALPNVLNLAAAGGLDLARASDMVTDAQTALGLSMEESARLVDEMALTATKSNTSVGQLGEAILTVGGTAKFMAGGTQELNQVLGALADNSIKGTEGGTKLRNIILSLSSPTEKAAKQLEQLGVAVFDAEGNMRQFSEIFPEMQRALSQLTDQEQITALGEIFNNRDIAAAQALLGTTAERWDELAAAIDGAAGSAEQMAKTRLDNLAGDITLLQSAADGARIAFSDSLTPALRDATQAGTGVLTVVGDVLTEVPFVGNAVTGLTAGVGVLAVGMAGATAATTGLTGVLTAAAAAAAASPWGLAALAVGGLVTAFTAVRAAAEDAKDANEEFLESLEETKETLAEDARTAQQNAEQMLAQADALLMLAEAGELTAVQEQALLNMIRDLNAAVPGLNLAYDEQTGKLNMTAEAVRNLTAAEAERMSTADASATYAQLLAQQAEVTRQLTEAEIALEEARAANKAAMTEEIVNGKKVIQLNEQAAKAQSDAAMAVSDLQQQYDALQTALDEIAAEYGEVASDADGAASSLEGTAGAAEEAGSEAETAAASLKELEEATLYAAGAADTMSDALKEQEKEGSLSYQTAQKLIEAGYEAALSIDQETGAVTLNRAAYMELAGAKIQAQIASLESAKAELESKKALDAVTKAADQAGGAYWEAAKAKAAMAYADDAKALDLQIAALNRAQAAMASYSTASTKAAKKSSSASKKIKTQAEQDLEEYKTLKATLDHEQTMGLIQDQEYYRQLGELRDQYLGDSANLSEYRKASETIYKAQQKAAKEALKEEEKTLQEREKAWQTASDNILKLEEEFQQKLSKRAEEIAGSYKLFEQVPERQKVAGTQLIANLEGQIASIESFYSNLEELAAREVDTGLVEEIRKMGVSAAGELEGLLSLTDDQLTKYSELYGEKQALANEIASKELEDLRELTNQEILGQLDDVAELYDTNGPALGLGFANSLADGMFEGMPAVEAMGETLANAALSAFERTYSGNLESMMTQSGGQRLSRSDIGELLAGAVNGINIGAGGGSAYPVLDVSLTMNNRVVAEEIMEPIRQVEKENPPLKDD